MRVIYLVDEEFIKKYTRAIDSSRNKHIIEIFLRELDTTASGRKDVLKDLFSKAENYRWPVPVVQLLILAVNDVYGYTGE